MGWNGWAGGDWGEKGPGSNSSRWMEPLAAAAAAAGLRVRERASACVAWTLTGTHTHTSLARPRQACQDTAGLNWTDGQATGQGTSPGAGAGCGRAVVVVVVRTAAHAPVACVRAWRVCVPPGAQRPCPAASQ